MTMEESRGPQARARRRGHTKVSLVVLASLLLSGALSVQAQGGADAAAAAPPMARDPEKALDLMVSDLPPLPVARASEKFTGALGLAGMTVAEFIALLADKPFLNINVILAAAGGALDAPVQVELNDITIGEAFNLVLQLNGLRAVRFNENTFIIISNSDRRTFGVKRRKIYRLVYVSTTAVVDFITQNPNLAGLVDLQNVVQDTNNNSLLVIDSPDRIALLDHVISLLDSAPNKVTARIPVSHVGIEDITAAIQNLPAEVRDRINPQEMIFSPAGRTLIVYDTPEDLTLLRDIIRQIDIGVKQVLIDVSIMEVTETVARNLGLQLRPPAQLEVTSIDKIWNLDRLSGDLAGAQTSRTRLTYELQQNGGNTIANPKIRVVDEQSATINVGQIRNVRVQTSQFSNNNINTAQQTTFNTQEVPIGVTLAATPRIHNDGTVTLQLDIQDEEIIGITEFGVDRTTRNSSTTLRIRDGETVILGGFINRNTTYDRTPIPIFGQIPLLKKLFRNNTRNKTASELIILLTPYILDYNPVLPKNEVELVPPSKPVQAKNFGYSDETMKPEVKTTTTRWVETKEARTKVIYDAQGEVIYQRSFPRTKGGEAEAGNEGWTPPPEILTGAAPTGEPAGGDAFVDLRSQPLEAPAVSGDAVSGDAGGDDWQKLMGDLKSMTGG